MIPTPRDDDPINLLRGLSIARAAGVAFRYAGVPSAASGSSEPTRAREIQMDTMAMMKSMDMGEMTMDMDAMQECMQSLNACAMAAAMCAGSDMMHGAEMATCCAMCSNMVEMAQATMHMMMRPAGMNMDVMSAMMTACMTMGKACAAECRAHADMDEMCRYCAMACDDMVMKCEAMMASMTA